MKEITPTEAAKMQDNDELIVLDVRDHYEVNAVSLETYQHIPMNQIPQTMDQIPRDITVGVLCHHGVRSRRVTQFLIQNGFSNIVNIRGGIDQWSKELDPSVPSYTKSFGQVFVSS